jgi:hypothetical protein
MSWGHIVHIAPMYSILSTNHTFVFHLLSFHWRCLSLLFFFCLVRLHWVLQGETPQRYRGGVYITI